MAHALLAGALLLCGALFFYAPARAGLYPACPIRCIFGIACPGCGATRALAALLHGRVMDAVRLNALFVLMLPFALACAVESYRRALRTESFRWPQPPAAAVYATLGAAVIFTFVRNLV